MQRNLLEHNKHCIFISTIEERERFFDTFGNSELTCEQYACAL